MAGGNRNILRVVLTGSECTGKSTLAALLGKHFNVPVVPEYLRTYFIEHGGVLTYEDATPIAKGQLAAEEQTAQQLPDDGSLLLLCDTNILSSVVYNHHYYGKNPSWIEDTLATAPYDLYLLCDIDVPWQSDGQRDMPDGREYMQGLFEAALKQRSLPYTVVSGSIEERFAKASTYIANMLKM